MNTVEIWKIKNIFLSNIFKEHPVSLQSSFKIF